MRQGFPPDKEFIGAHYTQQTRQPLARKKRERRSTEKTRTRTIIHRQPSRITHRHPQPPIQRIIPHLRNREIALPPLQIHAPAAKPTGHTRPQLELRVETQRIPDPRPHVRGPQIGALDLARLGDMRHGRDAVPGVGEITARFLSDAVLREGVLAPEIFDLLAGCEAIRGRGFGAGAVGGEVDVCGGAAGEFAHGFVVRGGVVEEDGDALGGFQHHYRGKGGRGKRHI